MDKFKVEHFNLVTTLTRYNQSHLYGFLFWRNLYGFMDIIF